MFIRAQKNVATDIVLAGLRGLPRVLELDNAIMRGVKKHYEDETGADIAVHVLTLQHSDVTTSPYYDTHADEPILVVTFLRLSTGGSQYRRAWRENNKGRGEIKIGSVTLEVFMDPADATKKTPMTSGRMWEIDSKKLTQGRPDMGRVIMEMGFNVHKLEFLVKATARRGADRWYGLLKAQSGSDGKKDIGTLSIRERAIPRLNDRPESRVKGLDPVNLEPMEDTIKDKAMVLGGSTLIVEKTKPNNNYQSSGWNKGGYVDRRNRGGYGIPPSVQDPFPRKGTNSGRNAPQTATAVSQSSENRAKSRSRSRSRSKSNERECLNTELAGAELSNLRDHKLSGFSLLKSPDLAAQAIKRTLSAIDDQILKEDSQRPGLRMKYGVKGRDGSPQIKK
jgi:hypothetical protein